MATVSVRVTNFHEINFRAYFTGTSWAMCEKTRLTIQVGPR